MTQVELNVVNAAKSWRRANDADDSEKMQRADARLERAVAALEKIVATRKRGVC